MSAQKPDLKIIAVSSLLLDPDNPRFFQVQELKGRKNLTQEDLMKEIEKDPDIPTLSKSILKSGVKDPIWVQENTGKPLCADCFRQWNKYQDEDYEEKYCHSCGKSTKTSFAKPLCMACWKKFS
jgi:hypothetical protein